MQLYYDIHDGTGPYVLMVHGLLHESRNGDETWRR